MPSNPCRVMSIAETGLNAPGKRSSFPEARPARNAAACQPLAWWRAASEDPPGFRPLGRLGRAYRQRRRERPLHRRIRHLLNADDDVHRLAPFLSAAVTAWADSQFPSLLGMRRGPVLADSYAWEYLFDELLSLFKPPV